MKKCNLDYYRLFTNKKERPRNFTDNELQAMKNLDSGQLSKYIGARSFLDMEETTLLNSLASLKDKKFSTQSQKGSTLEKIQQYAKDNAEIIATKMYPDDAQAVLRAGEALLLNRGKGQVFSMAEKELITPVFINTMNNLPFLSRQITQMLDEGNDAAAAVLSTELNKSMAKVAAFFGDMNATSNALNHYKKINADIKLGREISSILATGGC